MIHIRVDNESLNSKGVMACGMRLPEMPEGDTYWFDGESGCRLADCQGCNPGGPRQLGTPISELSGRPGEPGFRKFSYIAASWGYD